MKELEEELEEENEAKTPMKPFKAFVEFQRGW
jgi:hypothetical protein